VGEEKRGLEGHLAYLLRQANAAVRHALDDALAPTGLTHPQFVILTLLRAYGSMSGADVARLAALTPQTITTITGSLLRMGAISKTPDPSHGKALLLAITKEGLRLLFDASPHAEAIEQKIRGCLGLAPEALVRAWLVAVATELAGDP
jgi:DNA-binding MarR family transcriptional regulator